MGNSFENQENVSSKMGTATDASTGNILAALGFSERPTVSSKAETSKSSSDLVKEGKLPTLDLLEDNRTLDEKLKDAEDLMDSALKDGNTENPYLHATPKISEFIKNFKDSDNGPEITKLEQLMMAATIIGGDAGLSILNDVKENLAPAAGLDKVELKKIAAHLRDDVLWGEKIGTNLSILNGFVGGLGGGLTRGMRH